MTVLERSELDASPLADLHAIADQIGLDGFRRLRKAELIDAILARSGSGSGSASASGSGSGSGSGSASGSGSGSGTGSASGTGSGPDVGADSGSDVGADSQAGAAPRAPRRRRRASRRTETPSGEQERETGEGEEEGGGAPPAEPRRPRGRRAVGATQERTMEGVVELLGNGSAFLRVSPPDASDEDVYISAAQVRRCELVSGDRVSGPARTPRASERYPSLARVDTINGAPAESVAKGTRYEELAVAYPQARLELDPQDPTLSAIEWLTPIGRGSRAVIVGAARAGKTETLRRLLGALSGREGLEVMLVLSGVRPEEIAAWREGPVAPAAALDLAASAELQSQTVEHVIDTAKRTAARGGDVVVLIDTLDGLPPHVARRLLAGARKLAEGGSLTLIATASRPLGGETTVIALDVALTSTGRIPALDLAASGTVRPELLVGEEGAAAILKARASAIG
ncbi:MAG TPA: Rho termination factor N-terminal domain-containing protein [Solirubrobacteraceae bacterium]|nr:Rho termination factor N-terminal domain-containing protein [Solirubrobacteraceae bacterium]